jgi:hypothetical protein
MATLPRNLCLCVPDAVINGHLDTQHRTHNTGVAGSRTVPAIGESLVVP